MYKILVNNSNIKDDAILWGVNNRIIKNQEDRFLNAELGTTLLDCDKILAGGYSSLKEHREIHKKDFIVVYNTKRNFKRLDVIIYQPKEGGSI